MRIHITGIAGFIGFHVAKELQKRGHSVNGSDILTDYYDVELKKTRLTKLAPFGEWIKPDIVLHLAAQPGVLYSKENPYTYVDNNITAFVKILEYCRQQKIPLIYASSSTAINPKSVYGVTKLCDEHLARVYRDSYDMKIQGICFYSVYGPWGRPDMAYWKWTEQIFARQPVTIRGKKTSRDFTYIDDVTTIVCNVIESGQFDKEVKNIGRGSPRYLDDVIDILEECIGITTNRKYTSLYIEEELSTDAYTNICHTDIEDGLPKFIEWYKEYKGL